MEYTTSDLTYLIINCIINNDTDGVCYYADKFLQKLDFNVPPIAEIRQEDRQLLLTCAMVRVLSREIDSELRWICEK